MTDPSSPPHPAPACQGDAAADLRVDVVVRHPTPDAARAASPALAHSDSLWDPDAMPDDAIPEGRTLSLPIRPERSRKDEAACALVLALTSLTRQWRTGPSGKKGGKNPATSVDSERRVRGGTQYNWSQKK